MNTVTQHRLAVEARKQRAAEELDGRILRYRAWCEIGRACCGHPKAAITCGGDRRTCRVCLHTWLTLPEEAGDYVPGDCP